MTRRLRRLIGSTLFRLVTIQSVILALAIILAALLPIRSLVLVWLVGLFAIAVTLNGEVVRPIIRLEQALGQGRSTWPPSNSLGLVRKLSVLLRRAVHRLDHQERVAGQATKRQELAMQEIHHRVKNNLQVVASLLNLQGSRIRQPEARAEFQAARDRIRALATLHRHLYVYGEIHTIEMGDFLDELCGQLFKALGETPGGRLQLLVQAPALKVSSDQAVPLALIVTEAVTNAVKYAFPDGRTGHITVTLKQQGEHAVLEIADDGIGIPSGRQQTEAGMRDGIGLQLITGFARQLNATLLVDEVIGTRYVVTFPLRPARFDSPAVAGI